MKTDTMLKLVLSPTIAALMLLTGCRSLTARERATGTGAAVGGTIGAILGHNIAGETAGGAALGALAGGAVGYQVQQNREEQSRAQSSVQQLEADPNNRVYYVPNDDGTRTVVVLERQENGWVGPRGEIYPTPPTLRTLTEEYGS